MNVILPSMYKFLAYHYSDTKRQRLGQRFYNCYLKTPWPTLYHAEDGKAQELITQWLTANGYTIALPHMISHKV